MNHDNELIRKIQLKELEILKVFQKICKRHNLRYFAIGGTCLGAVRHKGFIPWDDDVDVAMPSEDYEKFLELANSQLPENYGILTHVKSKHIGDDHIFRLHDLNTTFVPPWHLPFDDCYRGIYIDVMSVPGLPSGRIRRKILRVTLNLLQRLNNRIHFYFGSIRSVQGFFAWLLCFPFMLNDSFDYFSKKREEITKRYPFGCSDKIIFPWRDEKPNDKGWYKNILLYDDFKDTVELPFEDTTISVPIGYDRYLTMDFGDYMTLPPEEERESHHLNYQFKDAIIDFDRPYTYYVQQKEAGKLCS